MSNHIRYYNHKVTTGGYTLHSKENHDSLPNMVNNNGINISQRFIDSGFFKKNGIVK